MLQHARGRYRPLVVTAIFTGLRASELRALRWSDVDLPNAELTVRGAAVFPGFRVAKQRISHPLLIRCNSPAVPLRLPLQFRCAPHQRNQLLTI